LAPEPGKWWLSKNKDNYKNLNSVLITEAMAACHAITWVQMEKEEKE